MSTAAAVQRVGDGIATVALGVAEMLALSLSVVVMIFIVVVSQVVRVSQERKERRSIRRSRAVARPI